MKEKDIRYGITILIESKGPGLYIVGHGIEEMINVLTNIGNEHDDMRWDAMKILRIAQECNASLREIQNVYEKGKLCISFEFESWEDFLSFKQIMEEHSQ